MKKFDIKKLLILVLAFVMVFALVACNKDSGGDEDPTPTPTPTPTPQNSGKYIQPAAYFDALWKASAVLGLQTFKEADPAALSLDLDVKLALGEDVLDLGVAIGAVVDPEGKYTAVKVQLYDHDKNANWFTIFYFAEDQDNLYVEAYDQKLCIPVAVSKVLPDVGALVKDLLDNNGITAVINKVKTAGGADWTIDNLVDVILGLLNMSLDDVIDLVNGLGVVTLDEGSKSLLPILEQLGGILFNAPKKDKKGNWTGECTKEAIDGGYCYTGNVGGSLGLVGMLAGMASEFVGDLIGEDSSLQLIFNTVEDDNGIKDIDGFKIKVQSYDVDVAGGKDVTVEIGINEVKIENLETAKAGDAANFFGFVKDDFKTNFNINLTVDLGITNKAIAIAYDDLAVDFTGNYKLVLNGIVDLKNGINTKADLALTFNGDPIISAYFGPQDNKVSQLVVKVDNTVKIDEKPVVATLAKLFAPYGLEALAKSDDAMFQKAAVDLSNAAFGTEFAVAADVLNAVAAWKADPTSAFATYNSEFKGAAIENLDLVTMVVDLINGLLAGGEEPAVSSAEPALSIPGLIATVFDAISFENGISVKVNSILATIQAIFGKFDAKTYAITPLAEADALAMLGITETGLTGWWTNFFAGSSWIKIVDEEADEVASLTNLLKSGAEVAISIGEVAQISAKVTTPDNATVTATITLKGEVESDYVYKTIETTGLVLLNVAAAE